MTPEFRRFVRYPPSELLDQTDGLAASKAVPDGPGHEGKKIGGIEAGGGRLTEVGAIHRIARGRLR